MKRKTFRNFATAGLVGLTALLGGCHLSYEARQINGTKSGFKCEAIAETSNFPPTIKRKKEHAKPSSGAFYSGNASVTYANNFLRDNIVVGRGPVVQSQAVVERKNNIVERDSIIVGAFGNYDIKDGQINEADFSARVVMPVYFWENFVGGYDNPLYGDYASIAYDFREYPNGLNGNNHFDHIVSANYTHSSRADLKFDWAHLMPDSATSEGSLFKFTAQKRMQLGQLFDNRDFFIKPYISTGYAFNWYGIEGFTAVTSGVDITFEKGNSIIGGRIQCQSSLNHEVQNALCTGIDVGIKF